MKKQSPVTESAQGTVEQPSRKIGRPVLSTLGTSPTTNPERPIVQMLTLTGVRKLFGWLTAATFTVQLSKGRVAHLQAELPREDDCYAVVLVDAARFMQLWRAPLSSHKDVATLDAQSWPNDDKYHYAVDGFAHGAENPVPLALVSCGRAAHDVVEWERRFLVFRREVVIARRGDAYLSFTNGITRTIYLLANGASAFPVLCDRSSAELLFDLAGHGAQGPLMLSSLR